MIRSMNHDSDANIRAELQCESSHDFEDGACRRCGEPDEDDATPTGPVPDGVTRRIVDLLFDASEALAQAAYEGSHTLRGNPEPTYGSPWTKPDLPADMSADLDAIRTALEALRRHAIIAYASKENQS